MKKILWVIILVATIFSFVVVLQRWQIERSNNTVEIVYDLTSLIELSKETGIELEHYFSDLKNSGINTIALEAKNLGQSFIEGYTLSDEIQDILFQDVNKLADFLYYPVAFSRQELETVRQAGFKVAPKITVTPWYVEPIWLYDEPDLVIISGKEPYSAELLKDYHARVALVEFSTPQNMSIEPDLDYIRLHGISASEIQVLSSERILNRYLRAVKERNIRILYIRAFVEEDDGWQRSIDLLTNLEQQLTKAGYNLGTATGFAKWDSSLFLILITALGIWAAAIIVLFYIWPNKNMLSLGLGIMGYLGTNVGLFWKPELIQSGLALLAAIVFPCFAVLVGIENSTKPRKTYWLIAILSFLGALFVVSTMTGTGYLLKIREFRGVKLMHIVPIILVFFILIRPLKPWLKRDIPVPYLIAAAFVGVVGLIYIARTGNFGVPAPSWEIKFREFLEKALLTRPRTKEFLVGYPALYFALQADKPRNSRWLPVAIIGPISLINTFTHTHTALWISLLRSVYGLILGYVIGWIAFRTWVWIKRRLKSDRCQWLLRVR